MAKTKPRGSFFCLTVDLDTLGFYRDIHGLPSQRSRVDPAYTVGVRRLLDLCDRHDIKATLFVIGRDVESSEHARLLEEAVQAGHELGNHTYHHRYDLPNYSLEQIEEDIRRGEDMIEAIAGVAPSGYRAPGYNMTPRVYDVIEQRGYRYDSSVFPCPPYYFAKFAIMSWRSLQGRPSRSAMTPLQNLLAPIRAYQPANDRFWKHDNRGSGPIEIPMALIPGCRFPLIGTSLHLLGRRGFDLVQPLVQKTYPSLLQLEFHAIDFMDADDPQTEGLEAVQPDLKVPWSQKCELYDHIFSRLKKSYRYTSTLGDAVSSIFPRP